MLFKSWEKAVGQWWNGDEISANSSMRSRFIVDYVHLS